MNNLQQKLSAHPKLVAWAIAVVLALGLITTLYISLHDGRPAVRRAADSFMEALSKQDTATSYRLFTPDRQKQLSLDAWQKQVDSAFRSQHSQPKYLRTEAVSDPARVYKTSTTPTRLVYAFTFDKTTYDMSVIMLNTGTPQKPIWLVNEWETLPQ